MGGGGAGEVRRKVKTPCTARGGRGGQDPTQETSHDSLKQQPPKAKKQPPQNRVASVSPLWGQCPLRAVPYKVSNPQPLHVYGNTPVSYAYVYNTPGNALIHTSRPWKLVVNMHPPISADHGTWLQKCIHSLQQAMEYDETNAFDPCEQPWAAHEMQSEQKSDRCRRVGNLYQKQTSVLSVFQKTWVS